MASADILSVTIQAWVPSQRSLQPRALRAASSTCRESLALALDQHWFRRWDMEARQGPASGTTRQLSPFLATWVPRGRESIAGVRPSADSGPGSTHCPPLGRGPQRLLCSLPVGSLLWGAALAQALASWGQELLIDCSKENNGRGQI